MRLYNTLTRRVEDIDFPTGTVTMYVCGVTPYDTSHLGHARVGIVYDTLRRYLESQDLRVRYVQNVTDIDEPLFERARRDGIDWQALGAQQAERYLQSMAQINVPKPEYYVPATSCIPEMLPVIARLIELEHAYPRNGAVYYRVASKEQFGALAHTDTATLLVMANQMGNNPDDPNKLDPLDFVLWQPSAPDEPRWDSPWGPGRPGWHIECSTIATQYLGSQIDIHGGGADLIFPHHSCEIAQTEPVTGVVPFVRCWMHTGLVSLGGTKMSKSLGNMVFVEDVLATYSPTALRLAVLAYLYREPFEYTEQQVVQAEQWAIGLKNALTAQTVSTTDALAAQEARAAFFAALAEDFNTPAAIGTLVDLASAITTAVEAGRDVRAAQQTLHDMALVLGLQIPINDQH